MTETEKTARVEDTTMILTITHPLGYSAEVRVPLEGLEEENGELDNFMITLVDQFEECLDLAIADAVNELSKVARS